MTPDAAEPPSGAGAVLRAAWRALPAACAEALAAPAAWLGAGASALLAAALTLALGAVLKPPPAWPAPPQAAIAASHVLALALLCAAFVLLPREPRAWGGLRAALRFACWSAGAWLGFGLASISTPWAVVFSLAALVGAYGLGLLGAAALLERLCAPYVQPVRIALALFLALSLSSLLWTRAPLVDLYNAERAQGRTGACAVLALGPVSCVSGVWARAPGGFDLLRSEVTYRQWVVGMYDLLPYPELWPRRYEASVPVKLSVPGEAPASYETRRLIDPGLVLAFGPWGLALVVLSDVLGAGRNVKRET
ncbi:MAG: hypothetical protein M5U26_30075 [Planctomycetota bacterium]|nr:hypothetical protein [Planctomycetota bacterium]